MESTVNSGLHPADNTVLLKISVCTEWYFRIIHLYMALKPDSKNIQSSDNRVSSCILV